MTELYTSNILSPHPYLYHDIDQLTSLLYWASSFQPTTEPQTVEYPFYNASPLPPFNKTQIGYAPFTKFDFFLYNTALFNTTACYEIYDEFNNTYPYKMCKIIPTFEANLPPVEPVTVSQVTGSDILGCVWYIGVSRHPALVQDLQSASYEIKTFNIKQTFSESIVTPDFNQGIPEIRLFSEYDSDLSALNLKAEFVPTEFTVPGNYTIWVNKLQIPETTNFNTIAQYACSVNTTDLIYPIPSQYQNGGIFYTLIHDNTNKGALAQTMFVTYSGNEILQNTTYSKSTNLPSTAIEMFITNNYELSCNITLPGTWYVSGCFIDTQGDVSNTLKINYNENFTGVSIIDTITGYDDQVKNSLYGDVALPYAGGISTKYNLFVSDNQEYSDIRTIYVNYFSENQQPIFFETITTSNNASAQTLTISGANQSDNTFDLYAIPSDNSKQWYISGFKIESNFFNVSEENITIENALSSSWIGDINVSNYKIGDLTNITLDTINYFNEQDLSENFGAKWDILIRLPGGELIVKKNIHAVWSHPENNLIKRTDIEEVIYDPGNIYEQIKSVLGLYLLYETDEPRSPINLGIRTTIPIEVYLCRQKFSEPITHLSMQNMHANYTGSTYVEPFTAIITPEITAIDTYPLNYFTYRGVKYDFIVKENINEYETNYIATHKQITTDPIAYGNSIQHIQASNTSPDLGIFSQKNADNTVSVGVTSTENKEFYVAGYKTYNNSLNKIPDAFSLFLNNSSLLLDSIFNLQASDTSWYLVFNSVDNTANKIIEFSAIFGTDYTFSTVTNQVTSITTNSDALSTINCFILPEGETFNLYVTGDQAEVSALSGVNILGYKSGISNFCIKETLPSYIPQAPDAAVTYTFTYPGSYSVQISALSSTESTQFVVSSFSYPNYFKIIDIPPLPRFDVTSTLPITSDYESKPGFIPAIFPSGLSYYNSICSHSLTGYETYINTWSTAPGSFPIDRISIDFGDGSEIETIYKNRDLALDIPPIAFPKNPQDPRNKILKHKYLLADTFTITITAFSENTNTYSIGRRSGQVNPIVPAPKYIISNILNDDDTIIYNTVFSTDDIVTNIVSPPFSNIEFTNALYYNITA